MTNPTNTAIMQAITDLGRRIDAKFEIVTTRLDGIDKHLDEQGRSIAPH